MQFLGSKEIDFTTWHRAQNCIAQGALTNSKHPNSLVLGVYPTHVVGGGDAYLYDERGNRYIDYICGLGVNLFGYGHPKISEAIQKHLYSGFSHSLPTTFEVETAEALKSMFVFVDRFKFLKSGSEACSAAIRIARAHTKRDLILSDAYHGWHDDFVSLTPPASGVPERAFIKPLKGNLISDQVAAVIIEPVIDDHSEERMSYLYDLKKQCERCGTLLIFDEVITGFRFQKHSVAQSIGLYPDLIILGKAMASGLPLAAVGGKAEVMDGNYFVSSTYAGEILSLAACKAVVDILLNQHEYKIDRLWEAGERFISKFNEIGDGLIKIKGYPTRGVFIGDPLDKALLFQEAAKGGILLCNSWFYNFALMKYDHFFFSFLSDFVAKLKRKEIKLEGKMPTSPFAQRMRE